MTIQGAPSGVGPYHISSKSSPFQGWVGLVITFQRKVSLSQICSVEFCSLTTIILREKSLQLFFSFIGGAIHNFQYFPFPVCVSLSGCLKRGILQMLQHSYCNEWDCITCFPSAFTCTSYKTDIDDNLSNCDATFCHVLSKPHFPLTTRSSRSFSKCNQPGPRLLF